MHFVMPAVLFRMPGKTPILTLSNNAHRHADRTWFLLSTSLQEYTVSLFDYEFKALDKSKSISEANGDFGILVLNEENYSQDFGFLLKAEMPLLMK